jgi:hypothetical protein
MSRELKFRAWSEIGSKPQMVLSRAISKGMVSDLISADNWQVMQFSGLVDKAGVEIYEGDIVYIAGIGNVIVSFPFFQLYEEVYSGNDGDIEKVIGNIYENPELLDKIAA